MDQLFAPHKGGEAKEEELKRSLVAVSKLLSLPYEDFLWAITSSSRVKTWLLSFLQNKERIWEGKETEQPVEESEKQTLADRLARAVFTVYYRVFFDLSAREAHLVQVCRDNTLLSAPDVLDLCSVFGPMNIQGLRELVAQVFKVSSPLLQELAQCCKLGFDELRMAKGKRMKFETVDVIFTLQCFYHVSEETQRAVVSGAQLSSVTVAEMLDIYRGLKELLGDLEWRFEPEGLTAMLDLLHVAFLSNYFIPANTLLPDEEHLRNPGSRVSSNPVQELTDLLLRAIQDPETGEEVVLDLSEYESLFNLSKRVELALASNAEELDGYTEKVQYLIGILQISESPSANLGARFTSATAWVESSLPAEGKVTEELVQSIKDILPHLGSYFITKLLEHTEYSAEGAVQMVLENRLPESLAQLDFALERPPMPSDSTAGSTSAPGNSSLEQKPQSLSSSIHMFNEFSQDGLEQEEDEESSKLKAKIRAAALKYSEYDDEYDDAYEDIDFDVGDNTGGEPREWKPGMLDVDGKKRDKDGKEIKEDPNDLLKPNLNRKNLGQKVGHVEERSTKRAPRKSGDPVDAKTARFKSKNKSRIGNHSRKRGAAKKQSKGMF